MVTLGMIIARIESADNSQAIRFEPAVYARIHTNLFADKIISNIRSIHHCTYETAAVIYSTSYGKYQIMGNALYDPSFLDLKDNIFEYCSFDTYGEYNDVEQAQLDTFTNFVIARKINFTPQQLLDQNLRNQFAIHYNGSLDYAVNIQNALNHFGVK